ncbi:MAG: hypothetical protein VB120_03940 [Lachnospiraceae bacterium]|nr:hypothetical protein [Lachnospiraceae bacterium]
MKKKLFVTFSALAIISIFILTIRIYGVSGGLTIQELSNASTEEGKNIIVQKVLEDVGYDDDFNPKDATAVNVYFSNVYDGNKNDAVIVIQTLPKEAVVAVYTPNGDVYEYKSTVDMLSNVEKVEFVSIPSLNTNMILITDESNQMIGAFEKNHFLRGYACIDNEFVPILNIRKDVDAYWNRLWNETIKSTDSSSLSDTSVSYRASEPTDSTNNPNTSESTWDRIKENSNIIWDPNEPLTIHLSRTQELSTSTDKEAKNVPDKSSFVPSVSRLITSSHHWSDEWGEFIVREMLELPNCEKIAVIENYNESPYTLISENYNKSMILCKDGTRKIIDNAMLKDIE